MYKYIGKYFAVLLMALIPAACGDQPVTAEREIPAPHMDDAATQVGLSTSGKAGGMLNAPGNYVRGMAGNIDAAKKAAALATKKAEENLDMGRLSH